MKPEKSPDASGSPATYTFVPSWKAVTSSLSVDMLTDHDAWNVSGTATEPVVAPM
jgi:hypothetical protein